MTIKEVKTTKYGGKCAKCNREIKVGWTIGFDPDTKKIYCKPCMSDLMKAGKSDVSASQLDVILDLLGKIDLGMATLNGQINTLINKVDAQDKAKAKAKK